MIISTNNSQLTIYSTEVNTEELMRIQDELITKYGSRSKKQERHVDDAETRRRLLEEKDGEKRVLISRTECDSVEVPAGAHSYFETVYDFVYEVIELSPLGAIIEQILKGDLSALLKLRLEIVNKQDEVNRVKSIAQEILSGNLSAIPNLKPETISEEDLLQYAMRIVDCIKLIPVYSNESKHYLEAAQVIIDYSDENTTLGAVKHFQTTIETGNQIVDIVDILTMPSKGMRLTLDKLFTRKQ